MNHHCPSSAHVAVLAALLALSVASSSAASAAGNPAAPDTRTDWNQWRGPNRNGIAPDSPKLADAWGPSGPVQLWKSEETILGGCKGKDTNYGSPVVAKGRVYLYVHWTGYKDQPGAADVVVCLDANSGKTLWKTSFPGLAEGCHSSTPYVGDGKVYAVGSNGMYCLDAETGREIWKMPGIGRDVSASPALVAGVLVATVGIEVPAAIAGKGPNPGGLLKGFEPATGKELWACPQAITGRAGNWEGGVNSSAGVWLTDKGPRIIMTTGKLTCVNPSDGSVIWQGEEAHSPGTPAILGDLCVVAKNVAAYRLRQDKAEKLFGTEEYDRGASQLVYDGHVFATCNGVLRCFDLTGKTLWQKSLGGKIGSPVIADGKIYWICDDRGNKLLMTSATPAMPANFYVARVPALQFTTPAICGGRLFLRLKDGVGCYDLTRPPADVAKTADTGSGTDHAAKRLITFVDLSPSYPWDKATQLKAWPPEIKEQAATVAWATNQALDADGRIDLCAVQDGRKQETRNAVLYARVVLEAAAPGRLALSLAVADNPGRPDGLCVFVNGANVLRQDVVHGGAKPHEDLVVDLVAGKNALLFRCSTSNDDWELRVQATALDGLVAKQVAAKVDPAPVPAAAPAK